jgi:hypothetical protein
MKRKMLSNQMLSQHMPRQELPASLTLTLHHSIISVLWLCVAQNVVRCIGHRRNFPKQVLRRCTHYLGPAVTQERYPYHYLSALLNNFVYYSKTRTLCPGTSENIYGNIIVLSHLHLLVLRKTIQSILAEALPSFVYSENYIIGMVVSYRRILGLRPTPNFMFMSHTLRFSITSETIPGLILPLWQD